MRRLFAMLACCALLSFAAGCIAVPGPQKPCPYSLAALTAPVGVLLAAAEEPCD